MSPSLTENDYGKNDSHRLQLRRVPREARSRLGSANDGCYGRCRRLTLVDCLLFLLLSAVPSSRNGGGDVCRLNRSPLLALARTLL